MDKPTPAPESCWGMLIRDALADSAAHTDAQAAMANARADAERAEAELRDCNARARSIAMDLQAAVAAACPLREGDQLLSPDGLYVATILSVRPSLVGSNGAAVGAMVSRTSDGGVVYAHKLISLGCGRWANAMRCVAGPVATDGAPLRPQD